MNYLKEFKTSVEEVIANVEVTRELQLDVIWRCDWVVAILIKFSQVKSCFSWMNKKKWFLEMESISDKDAMKMVGMTKNWEYDINLVDKAAAGFERIDSHFEKSSHLGKMLSNSIACFRGIICEEKRQCGKLHRCHILSATATPSFLITQQPSTLREDQQKDYDSLRAQVEIRIKYFFT